MTSNSHPDNTDLAIIRCLQSAPRTTNKEIADDLNLSEATVASRLRSLEERGLMKVMLQRDVRAHGYDLFVLVDIHVSGRKPEDVAAELARMEEAASVTIMISNPEIVLQLSARDHTHLLELIETKLAKVKGIGSFSMLTALEVVKLDAGFGTWSTTP